MVSTLRGRQTITRHRSQRLGVGYTSSIRALALSIATCQYAKPLAIALCAAGYAGTLSIYSTFYTHSLTAPSGLCDNTWTRESLMMTLCSCDLGHIPTTIDTERLMTHCTRLYGCDAIASLESI